MLLYRSSLALPLIFGITAARGVSGQGGGVGQKRRLDLSELPWDDLVAKLDNSTVLLDVEDPPLTYEVECLGLLAVGTAQGVNYMLKDQPSGVCLPNYLCGLDNCGLYANDGNETGEEEVSGLMDITSWDSSGLFDPSRGAMYNVPSKVLFPQGAGDVAAAIKFAKEWSVELSVKNSGHSYTSASSKKDTLHLNMRSYQNYSSNGPIECSDQQGDGAIEEDLSNQPCKLALARNKPAVLLVGGGEDWNMVYGNVKAFNEQQESYMYHAVGGSSGSVSPMGWTWQGGLAGNMAGRMHGFGVDQVLQIEMILPSGLHVKFGPTEWEDASEEFIYPKTTKVSGVCWSEDMENWGSCQDDVDFGDLWFAVRGGLGGSWGVVLSVFLQLHQYEPLEVADGVPCGPALASPVGRDVFLRFLLNYYLDPSELGVSTDMSNRCGAATELLQSYCYGEGAADLWIRTWQTYIAEHNQTLQEGGFTGEEVNLFAGCYSKTEYNDKTDKYKVEEGPYAGRAGDDGATFIGTTPIQNILVPKTWLVENKDKAVTVMGEAYTFAASMGLGGSTFYWAFGGAATSDQANALSEAHRDAGFMLVSLFNMPEELLSVFSSGQYTSLPPVYDSLYPELFPEWYDMTDSNSFPGYYGSNHAGQVSLGPLKSNWSVPCPVDITQKEREDKCISLQEAIFGTKRLERLEAIKEAVDPDYMFDCNRCVGNNRAKNEFETDVEDGLESAAVVSSKTMASFLLTVAAALVM